MHVRLEIDRFLRANPDVDISKLSKEISGDKNLLADLRRGREMRIATERRIAANFMNYLEKRKTA